MSVEKLLASGPRGQRAYLAAGKRAHDAWLVEQDERATSSQKRIEMALIFFGSVAVLSVCSALTYGVFDPQSPLHKLIFQKP